jgi:hypothetical protein
MLGALAKRRKMSLDYQSVWTTQGINEILEAALTTIAKAVNEDITRPPQGISNISEWCKREGCWARLEEHTEAISKLMPEAFWTSLVSADESRFEAKTARQTQQIDNGIEAQRQVISIPVATWKDLYAQLNAKRLLSPKELGILDVAVQMPKKIPTEKQSQILIAILEKGRAEGVRLPE